MGREPSWMLLVKFIYLFLFVTFNPVQCTIFVISEETNETVRVINEKNIRAVSDAVEGYVVISSPVNACESVQPAPGSRISGHINGNTTTEEALYTFEEDDRIERDWVLLSTVHDCDVTTKARNAQLGGYKALIIQNIGSNDSQQIPWHILRFPLVKLNHVLVGEHDGDLLRYNFSYPNNRYFVKFEEDKFYQLMCYILIGIIIVLLSTMFALFWVQICCAIIIVVPHQLRQVLQRWLQPGKRRLTRPMLQLIPLRNWSSGDPFQACAICQEDFKENDKLRVLPCLHGFHGTCVDPWLLRRSRRCPCCMQRVRLPNDKKGDGKGAKESEDTFISSQMVPTYSESSPDEDTPDEIIECLEPTVTTTGKPEDPVTTDKSPQTRFHSAMSNPESSQGSCTMTSPSESRKSSQDGKSLDWQLRRFLQSFTYNPADGFMGSEPASISCQRETVAGRDLQKKEKLTDALDAKFQQRANYSGASSTVNEMNLAEGTTASLEFSHDLISQSCSTGVGNSTLEVQVGTLVTEYGSEFQLSSPYPASSNHTFTISTTRDRKTSDATTISGSLPRDESSFHIADEIHSEIISEEVFDEATSSVSPHSNDTAQAEKKIKHAHATRLSLSHKV